MIDVEPTPAAPPGAAPIMVVAAHLDDVESWCAGTLARAIDAGASVRLLVVTSGERGSADPAVSPTEVAARLAHVGQTEDPVRLEVDWRERATAVGAPVRLPLAEASHVLRLE